MAIRLSNLIKNQLSAEGLYFLMSSTNPVPEQYFENDDGWLWCTNLTHKDDTSQAKFDGQSKNYDQIMIITKCPA